jgi:hypothetical protein
MRGSRILVVSCAAGLLGGCTPEPIEVAARPVGGVDAGDAGGFLSLTDGLMAHWRLDENTGTMAADKSGNGHDGVLQGPGPTWVSGRWGSAVHFSGSDLISVAQFPPPPPMASYTVSAWVRIGSGEVGSLIANLVSTEVLGGGWALFATLPTGPGAPAQTYAFEYADSTNPNAQLIVASCPCVMTDSWVHLAAVLDGNAHTLVLYVNGIPSAHVAAPPPVVPGSASLNIGHSTRTEPGSAFPVTGAIDDVAIYSRPLTAQEITELNTNGIPPPH